MALNIMGNAARFRDLIKVGACLGTLALSACSAGQIGPVAQIQKPVEIGLSENQVELRVKANALRKTPWDATQADEAAEGSMSMGSVIGILLTGVPSAPKQTPAPVEIKAENTALSKMAQRYKASLQGSAQSADGAVTTIAREVRTRVAEVQTFAGLAQDVLLNGTTLSRSPRGRSDLTVVRETVQNLKVQHATFLEVANSYGGYAGLYASRNILPELSALKRKIDDLEALTNQVSRRLTSV